MASGMGTTTKETSLPFRPTARILQLLGDELIASARLAVFELVKNSYDADATRVTVRLDVRSRQAPTITITDDGTGMTLQILESVWLVPGNDHRQQQKKTLLRNTPPQPAAHWRKGTRPIRSSQTREPNHSGDQSKGVMMNAW